MVRVSRVLVPVAFAVAVLAACGGENPYEAARNAPPASTVAAEGSTVGDNGFVPERNLGDCVGTLERPDCGSTEKGGTGTYLTFAVLIAGLGFIFWRISIGIRGRDAVVNAPQNLPDAPSSTKPD